MQCLGRRGIDGLLLRRVDNRGRSPPARSIGSIHLAAGGGGGGGGRPGAVRLRQPDAWSRLCRGTPRTSCQLINPRVRSLVFLSQDHETSKVRKGTAEASS